MTILTSPRFLLTASLALVVSACATVPADRGIGSVEKVLAEKTGSAMPLQSDGESLRIDEEELTRILAFPLGMKDAERVALYRHPVVSARLAEVGIAQADLAQAGRLRNPGFSFTRFSGDDYEATTLFDIGGLVLMPLRKRLASRQLVMAQYRAASELIDHVSGARNAWIEAVAETHKTRLMEEMLESYQTANSLMGQMSAIGHSSRREAARSELELTEFLASLSRQRVRETGAREALVRQLGLWGADASVLTLPDALDDPPSQPIPYAQVASQAVTQRLDVEIARRNVDAMADNLRLTRRSPFLNVFELGPVVEASEGERETGFEIEFTLPIFDLGGVKSEKARIAFDLAMAQAENTAISAASQAREAVHAYRRAYDIAVAYRERVLPLRDYLTREEMLRYNGMLISVFDLLDDAAQGLGTHIAYVDALRDFWLADNRMKHVLVAGGSPSLVLADSGMAPTGGDSPAH